MKYTRVQTPVNPKQRNKFVAVCAAICVVAAAAFLLNVRAAVPKTLQVVTDNAPQNN